jgi:hypothetical protein
MSSPSRAERRATLRLRTMRVLFGRGRRVAFSDRLLYNSRLLQPTIGGFDSVCGLVAMMGLTMVFKRRCVEVAFRSSEAGRLLARWVNV